MLPVEPEDAPELVPVLPEPDDPLEEAAVESAPPPSSPEPGVVLEDPPQPA